MSACFDLVLIGALLQQLWILSSSNSPCCSSGSKACSAICFMLLCWFRQRFNLVYPPVSMSLKPIRYVDFWLKPWWVFHFCDKGFIFFNKFGFDCESCVLILQGLFWNTKLSAFSYEAIFFPLLILESGSYLIPP